MFSKLNQEFAKHTKAFQAVLFVVIVIPFVFFMPGVDIFGVRNTEKPDYIGTINGNEVSWDDYEAEARKWFVSAILSGNYGWAYQDFSRSMMQSDFQTAVLSRMNRTNVIKEHKSFDPGSVTGKDMKEYINKNLKQKITQENVAKMQQGQFGNIVQFDGLMETVRYKFQMGGDAINELVKNLIIEERFNDFIKNEHNPTEEEILNTVKTKERTYKIRSVDIRSDDYRDEPLKEYYEKNKEKYREENAVKATLVSFMHSKYEAAYKAKAKEYEAELKKAVDAAVKTVEDKPEQVAGAKANAERKFKAEKLRLIAFAEAKIFESAVKTVTAIIKDPKAASEAFKTAAVEKKYSTEESDFVTKKNLAPGNYFFDDEALTKEILSLSTEKMTGFAEGRNATYVLVFTEKGSHTPFKDVQDELMAKVYSEKLDKYYLDNRKDFELPKRYTVGLASFTPRLFEAEVSDNEEEIKALYDSNPSYKQPQRKLIQFSVTIDDKATDTEKKSLEEKLKAFVKTLDKKTPAEVESLTVKKEDSITKDTLGWKSATAFAGSDSETIAESFKVEVGKFTKVFVKEKVAAVVFVASERKETPYEEVKDMLTYSVRQKKLGVKAKEKADLFRDMLKKTADQSVKGINAAVENYKKANTFDLLTINDIPAISDLRMMSRTQQMMLFRAGTSAFNNQSLLIEMAQMTEALNYTRTINIPLPAQHASVAHKVIAFIQEVHPEGYRAKDDPDVERIIFGRLNTEDANKLAKEKAEAVKKELEAEKDPKKLAELLGKNSFKEASEVKFKAAEALVQEALKDSPKAGAIVSNFKDSSNIIVYVESSKEVSEEDIAKLRPEHEKALKEELQNKKLREFWENVEKRTEIKIVQGIEQAES